MEKMPPRYDDHLRAGIPAGVWLQIRAHHARPQSETQLGSIRARSSGAGHRDASTQMESGPVAPTYAAIDDSPFTRAYPFTCGRVHVR